MAFWTAQALPRLAQSESSGNPGLIHYPTGYTPSGVRSSASGLYGFLDSTWQSQAGTLGIDTSRYPRAYMAPADVQTRVAANTPISNWTCPGCNARASALATDPNNISDTPGGGGTIATGPDHSSSGVAGGSNTGSVSGDLGPGLHGSLSGEPSGSGDTSTATDPNQAQGSPIKLGTQPQLTKAITEWINSIMGSFGTAFETATATAFGSITNWFVRGFLIIVGVVIVAVGLMKLMDPSGEKLQAALKSLPLEAA
jgi:hypothetical protein